MGFPVALAILAWSALQRHQEDARSRERLKEWEWKRSKTRAKAAAQPVEAAGEPLARLP